jgi:hypothetical protein
MTWRDPVISIRTNSAKDAIPFSKHPMEMAGLILGSSPRTGLAARAVRQQQRRLVLSRADAREFVPDWDLAGCCPQNIGETCRTNQPRGFIGGKPSGFPLGPFRPLSKLPFDSKQKHRYLEYRWPPRVPLLLVPVEAEGFVADNHSDETSFFVCFACGRRGGRQIPDGPSFGNDPVPPPSCRHEQHPDLTVLGDREWQGTVLAQDRGIGGGHRVLQT